MVTTLLHHESHVILSVALNFEGDHGYYTTEDRLQSFHFPNPHLNIRALSLAEKVGHADGMLSSSHYNILSRIALLNPETLMITDDGNKCFRIVDLGRKYVSSICNLGAKHKSPIIGDIAGCNLHHPFAQLYLPNQSAILLTDGRYILKLNVTGKEHSKKLSSQLSQVA